MPEADFKELLAAATSVGEHFRFNSEKNWESSDSSYNRSEYFQLNLVELTQSLGTISFYERQDYSKSSFNSKEIEQMEKQAENQRSKWMAHRENMDKLSRELVKSKSEIKETDCKFALMNLSQEEDELDELLNLNEIKSTLLAQQNTYYDFPTLNASQSSHITIGSQYPHYSSIGDSIDDIQKWLDDVLDS